MNNLNIRIYTELAEWKYAENLLLEHMTSEKTKLKWFNAVLIIISLAGIAGWFRLENYKLFWTIILIAAQGMRLMQGIVFTSSEDLFNLKNSIAFYTFNILDLENLYYEFYKGKHSDNNIEKKFNILREKERYLFGQQNFDKIKAKKKLIEAAENRTDLYLKKIIKNVTYEY